MKRFCFSFVVCVQTAVPSAPTFQVDTPKLQDGVRGRVCSDLCRHYYQIIEFLKQRITYIKGLNQSLTECGLEEEDANACQFLSALLETQENGNWSAAPEGSSHGSVHVRGSVPTGVPLNDETRVTDSSEEELEDEEDLSKDSLFIAGKVQFLRDLVADFARQQDESLLSLIATESEFLLRVGYDKREIGDLLSLLPLKSVGEDVKRRIAHIIEGGVK